MTYNVGIIINIKACHVCIFLLIFCRVEVHFRLPCEHDRLLNFTARSTEILDVAQKRLSQFNKAVVQLKNNSNDTVCCLRVTTENRET